MKRLTDKRAVIEPGTYFVSDDVPEIPNVPQNELYYRLGLIENVLGNDYSLDRLRKLVNADREGRCTIFPCRDWLDLVFGEQEVFYGIDTDYIENPIREITVHNEERFIWYDGWKNLVFCGVDENGLDWEFSPEEVGKTVFLTEEQAESALKAMKERGKK